MGESRPERRETDRLLAEWHSRYRTPLLRFFQRRTRPDVDREDLVQEVFARLLRRDDLATVEKIDAYLFQTAANVLNDFLRRAKVRPLDSQVPLKRDPSGRDYISETALSPERVVLGKEAIEQLGLALAELPERAQTAFALYHFEEVPQAEIARHLSVSLSTIEKDLGKVNHHLLKRLRGWL